MTTTPSGEPAQPSGARPQWSADGAHWWDGHTWVPRHIVEAQHGQHWQQQLPPPPPSAYGAAPAGYGAPPPGAGGYAFARPPQPPRKGTPAWVWVIGAIFGAIVLAG